MSKEPAQNGIFVQIYQLLKIDSRTRFFVPAYTFAINYFHGLKAS
jgi:hypothetical protein